MFLNVYFFFLGSDLFFLWFVHTDLIDILTNWVIKHSDICRPEDISSLFQTLAMTDYPTIYSEELKSKLISNIQEHTLRGRDWLNFVWSLTVLDFATAEQIDSVLR